MIRYMIYMVLFTVNDMIGAIGMNLILTGDNMVGHVKNCDKLKGE